MTAKTDTSIIKKLDKIVADSDGNIIAVVNSLQNVLIKEKQAKRIEQYALTDKTSDDVLDYDFTCVAIAWTDKYGNVTVWSKQIEMNIDAMDDNDSDDIDAISDEEDDQLNEDVLDDDELIKCPYCKTAHTVNEYMKDNCCPNCKKRI